MSLSVLSFHTPLTSDPSIKIHIYSSGRSTQPETTILWQRKRRTIGILSNLEPLIIFISYALQIIEHLRTNREKYDLAIGIATFSSLLCLIAKLVGWQGYKLIYYCLDYYTQPASGIANSVIFRTYKRAEKILIKRADLIWDISPRIKDARASIDNIPPSKYQVRTVPLGYSDIGAPPPKSSDDRTPNSLGFVGTLSENQGLQLVVQAIKVLRPTIKNIHLHVVGDGPMRMGLEELVTNLGLSEHVTFYGFVKDDADVYTILQNCRVGVATWTGHEGDNSIYADPGKPKLYALLGLPVIITKSPHISELISDLDAGFVVDYNIGSIIDAINESLSKDDVYRRKLTNLKKFTPYCQADRIFDEAFSDKRLRT